MPKFRETPYSAFNYLVEVKQGQGKEVRGGFSEVSGLNSEITVAEYRDGNAPTNAVTKIPGVYKTGDITLKRGVIGADDLWDWIKSVREGGDPKKLKREVVIKLLDEARKEVMAWKLRGAMPIKWTGPTLAAKGGGDVAMEELVLSVETLDLI